MLVDNVHARHAIIIGIFLAGVIDRVMLGEVACRDWQALGFVGHDVGFAGDVRIDDRHDVRLPDAVDMERAGSTAAVNKRQNNVLVTAALALRTRLCLRPMKVSSTSTIAPAPPIGASEPSRIASRMRWPMNQAVFRVTPRVR